jgi:hypothetical protein
VRSRGFIIRAGNFLFMGQKIQTVCGYSCSDCDHLGNECPGCKKTGGKPFWTAFIGIDRCAIYDCCTNERKFPHCGKCPDLMCERFDRIKDNPDMNDAEAAACLAAMERDLRARK